MDEIKIFLGESGWMACFEGPHMARIIELFGQNVIPTAFTSRAPIGAVVAEIRDRNPGVRVSHWLED